MARRKKMPEEKNHQEPRFVVETTEEIKERVRALASREKQSEAGFIRSLISQRLREERLYEANEKKNVQK